MRDTQDGLREFLLEHALRYTVEEFEIIVEPPPVHACRRREPMPPNAWRH